MNMEDESYHALKPNFQYSFGHSQPKKNVINRHPKFVSTNNPSGRKKQV
jgi:hypothetical protein